MNPIAEQRDALEKCKLLHPKKVRSYDKDARRRLCKLIPPNADRKQVERAFKIIAEELKCNV